MMHDPRQDELEDVQSEGSAVLQRVFSLSTRFSGLFAESKQKASQQGGSRVIESVHSRSMDDL